jgi:hypothetical protein
LPDQTGSHSWSRNQSQVPQRPAEPFDDSAVTLTGNVGKNGGFNHYVRQERIWPEHGFKMLAFPKGGKKQRFKTRQWDLPPKISRSRLTETD